MKRILLFIAAALALAACGGSPAALPVKEITLDAQDIAFGTTTIEVAVGQPVKLILKNVGALEHDFNIATIAVTDKHEESSGHGHTTSTSDLHVSAAPGGTATLEFTPTQAGTYEFFCSTAGHKEAGMIGTLIVKEQ